jgi:hypothetical protein
VLAVVQHEQKVPLSQVATKLVDDRRVALLVQSQRRGYGERDTVGIREWCEIDVPDAIGKGIQHPIGDLQRQTRLAATADAGQR